jgi:hypothetical protein
VSRRRQWRTEARTTAIAGLVTQSVLTKRVPSPSPDAVGGRIALSRTFVTLDFKSEVSLCDLKFVKWLVRKNRALSMSKNDDEVNEFIDEVTDGAYNLPCVEVIFKLVKQMQPLGDERIKKIVAALAAELGDERINWETRESRK